MDRLTLLQAELNMHALPDGRRAQLEQLLTVAAAQLTQRGITLDGESVKDNYLQVEYAAWLYRRRMQQADAGIPRYLQTDIHDRLIAEKGRVNRGETDVHL